MAMLDMCLSSGVPQNHPEILVQVGFHPITVVFFCKHVQEYFFLDQTHCSSQCVPFGHHQRVKYISFHCCIMCIFDSSFSLGCFHQIIQTSICQCYVSKCWCFPTHTYTDYRSVLFVYNRIFEVI